MTFASVRGSANAPTEHLDSVVRNLPAPTTAVAAESVSTPSVVTARDRLNASAFLDSSETTAASSIAQPTAVIMEHVLALPLAHVKLGSVARSARRRFAQMSAVAMVFASMDPVSVILDTMEILAQLPSALRLAVGMDDAMRRAAFVIAKRSTLVPTAPHPLALNCALVTDSAITPRTYAPVLLDGVVSTVPRLSACLTAAVKVFVRPLEFVCAIRTTLARIVLSLCAKSV